MKNEFEENDYEYDTAVDALLAFLNFLPKDTVKMIDFDRSQNQSTLNRIAVFHYNHP